MASMLLCVATCICTPAMAKGVIMNPRVLSGCWTEVPVDFPAVDAANHSDLTRRGRLGQPPGGPYRFGPATIQVRGLQGINGAGGREPRPQYGVSEGGREAGEGTDKGPEG